MENHPYYPSYLKVCVQRTRRPRRIPWR